MKTNQYHWAIKTAALLIVAANASAQSNPDEVIYQDSTNRLSLSFRFGLNINAHFKGIGGSLNPSSSNPGNRKTPDGDKYNYDDGYALTDVSGNAGGQSWYWGYDNANQVNAGNHTVDLSHTTATPNGNPSASGGNDSGIPGFELAYDRQLGVIESLHDMRFGIEAAVNYQSISMNNNSTFGATASRQTDSYGYTTGTTPPSAPYQGSYNGPGFLINVPPGSSTTVIPNATVSTRDVFDANLLGFRLGPYLEFPFGNRQQQFTIAVSAGLAAGLLYANESWQQTVDIPGYSSITTHGGGNNADVLWGGYASLNATCQMDEHWSLIGGVQFQDLGKYNHSFDGRKVSLDLSQSVFVLVGISYGF